MVQDFKLQLLSRSRIMKMDSGFPISRPTCRVFTLRWHISITADLGKTKKWVRGGQFREDRRPMSETDSDVPED
jgi:hypothetical protein